MGAGYHGIWEGYYGMLSLLHQGLVIMEWDVLRDAACYYRY